jgi:diguanylate cyclase (GGDEF)-like protein
MTHFGISIALWLVILAAGLLVTILTVIVRDRAHLRRQRDLQFAVRERTEELECRRLREFARNRVLEMIVSNQSLGTVLEGVAELVRAEVPGAHAIILLKRPDTWHVGAAPKFPRAWLDAMAKPHAVPFEVWKSACVFPSPSTHPAWRVFTTALGGRGPVCIRSFPVGGLDIPLGAILVFEMAGSETEAGVLESAARLAQVAVEHRKFYDDLQFQAHHDPLTGLPNRSLFDERLHRALLEARGTDRRMAVLFVDLDRFKQINDTLSHRVGDILRAEIADRMRRVVRPGDTVARIGGDEFNVLVSSVTSDEEAEETAARILSAVREPVVIDGHTLHVSASLGIALFPDDGVEPEELKREADAAMYCAKGMGRNRMQTFSSRNYSLDRARMDQEMRAALREDRFKVHYQPKVGSDGMFGGFEALLRFDHPIEGPISPAVFIPIAEESGLIIALGEWVQNAVCGQIAEWHRQGFGYVSVAVNVSPVQICRPDFAKSVQECLGRHGVPPWRLEFELTESLLIEGGDESPKQIQQLRSLGIRFSIDDFGTGYSSLSYLHRLPVDAIKLDRSFVQSVDTDEAARRLVQAMIGVAQGLGLDVVAEGVETEAQRIALVAAGCPIMQGFLFAHPRPAPDLSDFLRRHASDLADLLALEGMIAKPVESGSVPSEV